MQRRAGIGVWLLVAACAHGSPRATDREGGRTDREPRAAEVDEATAKRALADLPPGACVRAIETELREGKSSANASCDDARKKVARKLEVGKQRFGVVEHREVDLVGMRLRLGVGRGCRKWALHRRGDVLDALDARDASCRLSPYRGPVTIVAADRAGRERTVGRFPTDRDGYLRLEFSDLDAAIRNGSDATGRGEGLDAFVRLEVGRDGWAGSVDLVRLRGFMADWHFQWVEQGRGVPALFVVRHPEHPQTAEAEALAVEARIQRQEDDYEAVMDGSLPAAAFLERHVWSPFRRAVELALTDGR